jgi:hypothetical protein
VAVAIVIVLVQIDYEELLLLPLLLGAINVQALVSGGSRGPSAEEAAVEVLARLDRGEPAALSDLAEVAARARPQTRDRLKVTAVEILARQRRIADARYVLAQLPGQVHPALYALVDAASGDHHAITMLDDMIRAQPVPSLARYGFLARLLVGRGGEIPAYHLALPASAQGLDALREAQYVAHVQGDFAAAAAIGELLVQLSPAPDPWVLYNTACSWSRAGDRDRALLRLSQAVDAGWADASQLDADQDLAPLWVTDRFREIRRRVALHPSTG